MDILGYKIQLSTDMRLDPTDAQYVQCIETSFVGINVQKFACGHANFVMYDAGRQPGCASILCDHVFARLYFKFTLDPKYKLIGSNKKGDKIVGWKPALYHTYDGVYVATKEPIYTYKTDLLGIYTNRTKGIFYIDKATKRRNSIYLRTQ